uniref:Calpain-6 n=1 Tax=Geotrypetes seraphini TaxID=260995 RepID=A0A6P8R2K2_GEOSA|nr:calpain-6 [Geotrypetes seraphini]XP_033802284.1 calpain-6 [Geotrypetes seraphini]XP_033802285.1 calpain-6 [Geotrypetes seraphini]
MSSSVQLFKNQCYHELKQQCVRHKQLFEDPEFPAEDSSLFYSRSPPGRVEWKRPKELCEDPQLIVDGISAHDLHQGKLGNCWLVAACSCLAIKKKLWEKVLVNWKSQEWNRTKPEKYAGIFHFRFWCLGKWTEVVIDDRLPTMDGGLIYCHSNIKNEFWSALLEKAYAKLSGSYEALDGGNTGDAMVDFTGAVAEHLDLTQGRYRQDMIEQTKLFEDLHKVHSRGGLISCSIKPISSADTEAVTDLGLVQGHAYSVTAVRKVRLGQRALCSSKSEKLFMIQMRNPWGKREWSGAWSDGSEEWKRVSQSERKRMGLTVADDGEFWMTFEDWCKNFTTVDIGRMINTSYFSIHKTWEKELLRGAWSRNSDPLLTRSGGCYNNKVTFLQNPQYVFDIKKAEDKVLVSLQQKDQRIYRKEGKGDNFIIGFEIFKVELNREHRIHKLHTQEKVATSTYINVRTVFLKKVLPQGRYVIVPTTFQPGVVSEFILRLFTDVPSKLRELELDKPELTCWSRLCGYPRRITQIVVHKVEGLQQREINPYLIIKCEKQKVRSPVQKKTSSAVFDIQAVFFRKNINQPIVIQVWAKKTLCDQFIGQALITASPSDSKELQTLQLQDKKRQPAGEQPGRVCVKVISADNLTEL